MYKGQIVLPKRQSYKWLLSQHELPINNALRLAETGKIHLRMHAGKLSDGILEPLTVTVSNIIGEFLLCFLEGFNLLTELPLNLPQQDLAGSPFPPALPFSPSSPPPALLARSRWCEEARSSLLAG